MEGSKSSRDISEKKASGDFTEFGHDEDIHSSRMLSVIEGKQRELEMQRIALQNDLGRLINGEANEIDCSFRDTCFAAKSKMGACPCELYRC
jgi:hypothetical protein